MSSSAKRIYLDGDEEAKRQRSSWMVFPGVDALKPYNIVFDYDRFEYELAVGLDFALAKAQRACNFNGEIVYFMKWKREDEISYISSEHASNLYTEATIKFHEKYNNISQIVTTVLTYKKLQDKGQKSIIKYSTQDSQQLFLINVDIVSQFEDVIAKKKGLGIPIQPFIVVIGQLIESKDIIVYFDDIK